MEYNQLKLENQICFPLYAASRLVIKEYQPHLQKLGITYPQYLVLLVLWEKELLTVNEISKKLMLNTNTVTPLLQRMQQLGILNRNRSDEDERKVFVSLTKKGEAMKELAADIPLKLSSCLMNANFDIEHLRNLKKDLQAIIDLLSKKECND